MCACCSNLPIWKHLWSSSHGMRQAKLEVHCMGDASMMIAAFWTSSMPHHPSAFTGCPTPNQSLLTGIRWRWHHPPLRRRQATRHRQHHSLYTPAAPRSPQHWSPMMPVPCHHHLQCRHACQISWSIIWTLVHRLRHLLRLVLQIHSQVWGLLPQT